MSYPILPSPAVPMLQLNPVPGLPLNFESLPDEIILKIIRFMPIGTLIELSKISNRRINNIICNTDEIIIFV